MKLNTLHTHGEWLSWKWFSPVQWVAFHWEAAFWLYLLLLIPIALLIRRFIQWQYSSKLEVSVPIRLIPWTPLILLRFLPDLLFSLMLACWVMALARPQLKNLELEESSEGVDILLVLDVSESMRLQDFNPDRLSASKEVARRFIRGRRYDRIGVVVFSGEAYSLAPLTGDYVMLENLIREIDYQMVPETGTAIGTALGVATNRLRESEASSKVVVLLSDGDNTAGSLDPITAAQLAAYYGIKIYTILVGKQGRIAVPPENPQEEMRYQENTVDEGTLKEIAQIGEGLFFKAENNQALETVFQKIDAYEKSEITETRFLTTRDYYGVYLRWGFIFFLLLLAFKSSPWSNILED